MPGEFKPSSFIPKKTTQNPTYSTSGSRVNAFLLIAGIIFVITLLSAGGVFLYERYLLSNIEDQKQSLERAREAFQPELIETLAKLDLRLDVAKQLLSEHTTVSPFLELLSKLTLKTVRFEDFEFIRSTEGMVQINMKGVAKSYRSIALQSEEFGESGYIHNPVFSDFKLDEKSNVTFRVALNVSNEFLKYENSF